jgi:hypothetical protein
MHDHTVRLVDDEEMLVLVHDFHGNILGDELVRGGRRNLDSNFVASAGPVALVHPTPADGHLPIDDQRSDL